MVDVVVGDYGNFVSFVGYVNFFGWLVSCWEGNGLLCYFIYFYLD